MATKITVDEVTQNVTVTVSNERGPTGQVGPNSITSATTSDGTATLEVNWLQASGEIGAASLYGVNINGGSLAVDDGTFGSANVTGTLTADHIHGNLAGSVYMHIRAGEALSKGDPVYVFGSHGTGANMVPIVMRADASNPAKMPAIAIMDAAVANNGSGHAVINGTIADMNTAAYSINSTLYVANGGGMTATKPANAQPVARVERSNANNGGIVVKVNGLYSDVSVASSQVTDATALSTPNTITKRDTRGSAAFGVGEIYNTNYEVYIGGDYPISGLENGNLWSIDQTGITTDRSYALPDASGTLILDSTLGAGVNGLSTITGAKSFTGQLQLTGQAATDTNSAMTRGLADARYPWGQTKVCGQNDFTTSTAIDITGWTGWVLEANTWYKLELAARITATSGQLQIDLISNQALTSVNAGVTGGGIYFQPQGATSPPFIFSDTRIALFNAQGIVTNRIGSAFFMFRTGNSAPTVKLQGMQPGTPSGTGSILGGVCTIYKLPMP